MQLDVCASPRRQARRAFLDGFSLHANTHLRANDWEGLGCPCRYGARGPLALERFEQFERLEDGRLAYRMKRPLPGGRTHLVFSGAGLLRKLTAIILPSRSNLMRYHCVFAPGARLRPRLAPGTKRCALAASTDAPGHTVPPVRRAPTPGCSFYAHAL